MITILSVDAENDADIPSIIATSAALSLSDIPWAGPVGAVRIGLVRKEGQNDLMVNPTYPERQHSDLDLVISGTGETTLMVEAGAKEVDEATMLQAFKLGQETNAKVAEAIAAWAKKMGRQKLTVKPLESTQALKAKVSHEKEIIAELIVAEANVDRVKRAGLMDSLMEKFEAEDPKTIGGVVQELVKEEARKKILSDGIRPDGRKTDQIREISGEVGLLPRTHGSAVFKRGATQALTITTLGSPAMEMLIESMEFGEEAKRYMHHYFMPPFTVGEVGRIGWPSRREVGHGALAEKAIEVLNGMK